MLRIPLPTIWMKDKIQVEMDKNLSPRRLVHLKDLVGAGKVKGEWTKRLHQAVSTIDTYPSTFDTTEILFYKTTLSGEQSDRCRKEIALWLAKCRNGDGGYGCKPGTTSFLEHVYWAVKLIKEIGTIKLSPQEAENTCAFVKNCQSKKGGFGRAPEGVPFIDSTYHALWILNILYGHK